MSDWLKKESEAFANAQATSGERQELIAQSNYWHEILEQLRQDIEFLNTQSAWKSLLESNPITLKLDGLEYRVEKRTIDSVVATLYNVLGSLNMHFRVIGMGMVVKRNWKETWKADTDGANVILVRDNDALTIPGEVSRHILTPFIEVLKAEYTERS